MEVMCWKENMFKSYKSKDMPLVLCIVRNLIINKMRKMSRDLMNEMHATLGEPFTRNNYLFLYR